MVPTAANPFPTVFRLAPNRNNIEPRWSAVAYESNGHGLETAARSSARVDTKVRRAGQPLIAAAALGALTGLHSRLLRRAHDVGHADL